MHRHDGEGRVEGEADRDRGAPARARLRRADESQRAAGRAASIEPSTTTRRPKRSASQPPASVPATPETSISVRAAPPAAFDEPKLADPVERDEGVQRRRRRWPGRATGAESRAKGAHRSSRSGGPVRGGIVRRSADLASPRGITAIASAGITSSTVPRSPSAIWRGVAMAGPMREAEVASDGEEAHRVARLRVPDGGVDLPGRLGMEGRDADPGRGRARRAPGRRSGRGRPGPRRRRPGRARRGRARERSAGRRAARRAAGGRRTKCSRRRRGRPPRRS